VVFFTFTCIIFFAAAINSAVALLISTTKPEDFSILFCSRTPSSTGYSNRYYYSWWTDSVAQATYANGRSGQYSLNWSGNNGNLIGGKGWNLGFNGR